MSKGVEHNHRMTDLYKAAGLSKQALFKYRNRITHLKNVSSDVVAICHGYRKHHKRMGSRKMYHKAQGEVDIGRDKFEQIAHRNGFKLRRKRSAIKTTIASRDRYYDNLMDGKTLTGINQAWQSDIFYLQVESKNYYGFTIIDVYSRKLLALHLVKGMSADYLIQAMKKAIRNRENMKMTNCIFHSDRGSQYISEIQQNMLSEWGFIPSMGKRAQQNAFAERVQGTLKYEYFFETDLKEKNLPYQVKKIMALYNNERPHSKLQMMTPQEFELNLDQMLTNELPEMQVYQWVEPILTFGELFNKKKKEPKKKKNNINNN